MNYFFFWCFVLWITTDSTAKEENITDLKQVASGKHLLCFLANLFIYKVHKGFPRKLLPNSFSLSVSHSLRPLPLPSLHSQLLLRECQYWRHVAFLQFPWARAREREKASIGQRWKEKSSQAFEVKINREQGHTTCFYKHNFNFLIYTHVHCINQHVLRSRRVEHKQACFYTCFRPHPCPEIRQKLNLCFLGQRTAEHVSCLLPENCSSPCNLFPFRAADAVAACTRSVHSCCCPVTGAQTG